ncbi:MAG: hypothetical protein RLZZ454_1599 [Pseudomonadota bacterium]
METILEVNNVIKQFGGFTALSDVNLRVLKGERLGLIGPNGSGKSTLLKAAAGLVSSSGHMDFHGSMIRPTSLGYMPQDQQTGIALSVLEVVLLGRISHLHLRVQQEDLRVVSEVLDLLGIYSLAGFPIGELSGGQRQLAFLAQALVTEPTILLLDEPTSALDICHQLEVLEVVRELTKKRNLTTLLVLHDLNAATRYCDDVALLNEGNLVACGSAADVLTTANVACVFEVEAEALICADGTRFLAPLRKQK